MKLISARLNFSNQILLLNCSHTRELEVKQGKNICQNVFSYTDE